MDAASCVAVFWTSGEISAQQAAAKKKMIAARVRTWRVNTVIQSPPMLEIPANVIWTLCSAGGCGGGVLCCALLCFSQVLEHLVGVAFGLHFAKDVLDLAIRADDERRSRHTHHFLAVHILFLDDAVSVANVLIGIGD